MNNQFEIEKKMKAVQNNDYELEIREEDLNVDELYKYLAASDVFLYPKPTQSQVVVPSTIFQCLGSLCPIVAYDSNFVSNFSDEIFKYKNDKELESALVEIFDQGKKYKKLQSSVKTYLQKYSSVQVAKIFEKLFADLGVNK